MFSLIGGGEKAGSGVDKIRQGWKSQHWRWPWLQATAEPNRIRWILPTVSLLSDETLAYLQERFGRRFERLSEVGRMALVLAHEEECVTNARLQQVSTMHPADISRELRGLVKSKFLEQARSGRWAEYHLPHKEPSLPHKEPSLPHKEASLPHKMLPSSEALAAQELTSLQLKTAEARQAKRLPPEKTREIIALICSKHYLTAEMIADLLARSVKTIRPHLGKMVQERRLFRTYPHDPTRSDQAYTSNPSMKPD
jgi:ATP-dependent DNA helicase RecG